MRFSLIKLARLLIHLSVLGWVGQCAGGDGKKDGKKDGKDGDGKKDRNGKANENTDKKDSAKGKEPTQSQPPKTQSYIDYDYLAQMRKPFVRQSVYQKLERMKKEEEEMKQQTRKQEERKRAFEEVYIPYEKPVLTRRPSIYQLLQQIQEKQALKSKTKSQQTKEDGQGSVTTKPSGQRKITRTRITTITTTISNKQHEQHEQHEQDEQDEQQPMRDDTATATSQQVPLYKPHTFVYVPMQLSVETAKMNLLGPTGQQSQKQIPTTQPTEVPKSAQSSDLSTEQSMTSKPQEKSAQRGINKGDKSKTGALQQSKASNLQPKSPTFQSQRRVFTPLMSPPLPKLVIKQPGEKSGTQPIESQILPPKQKQQRAKQQQQLQKGTVQQKQSKQQSTQLKKTRKIESKAVKTSSQLDQSFKLWQQHMERFKKQQQSPKVQKITPKVQQKKQLVRTPQGRVMEPVPAFRPRLSIQPPQSFRQRKTQIPVYNRRTHERTQIQTGQLRTDKFSSHERQVTSYQQSLLNPSPTVRMTDDRQLEQRVITWLEFPELRIEPQEQQYNRLRQQQIRSRLSAPISHRPPRAEDADQIIQSRMLLKQVTAHELYWFLEKLYTISQETIQSLRRLASYDSLALKQFFTITRRMSRPQSQLVQQLRQIRMLTSLFEQIGLANQALLQIHHPSLIQTSQRIINRNPNNPVSDQLLLRIVSQEMRRYPLQESEQSLIKQQYMAGQKELTVSQVEWNIPQIQRGLQIQRGFPRFQMGRPQLQLKIPQFQRGRPQMQQTRRLPQLIQPRQPLTQQLRQLPQQRPLSVRLSELFGPQQVKKDQKPQKRLKSQDMLRNYDQHILQRRKRLKEQWAKQSKQKLVEIQEIKAKALAAVESKIEATQSQTDVRQASPQPLQELSRIILPVQQPQPTRGVGEQVKSPQVRRQRLQSTRAGGQSTSPRARVQPFVFTRTGRGQSSLPTVRGRSTLLQRLKLNTFKSEQSQQTQKSTQTQAHSAVSSFIYQASFQRVLRPSNLVESGLFTRHSALQGIIQNQQQQQHQEGSSTGTVSRLRSSLGISQFQASHSSPSRSPTLTRSVSNTQSQGRPGSGQSSPTSSPHSVRRNSAHLGSSASSQDNSRGGSGSTDSHKSSQGSRGRR